MAALITRAMISWDEGHIGEGLELFRDASRQGTGISPDARQFQPLLALAAALVDLRQLDEAENILRAADNQALDGIPAQAVLSILYARIHMANGRLTDAAAAGHAALVTAEAMGARRYASTAHCILGVIALRRGDIAAAAHHIASRSARSPHFADTYARGETTMAQAQITEARDGPTAAISRIRQVCADLPAHRGVLLGDPVTSAWLIRTALAAGDNELAAMAARTAESLASDNPGIPPITAAVAHSMGLVGQDPAHLTEAVAQHHDRWAKASAAEDLGVLHVRQGDRDRAVHHLKEALGGYQLVGAATDMARIRGRLRKLGVRPRHWTQSADRPISGWQSLTDAERATSELVAQGLSNRQVASRMYISAHTVAFYMRQIFRKLNIGSRVELARIVVEQSRLRGCAGRGRRVGRPRQGRIAHPRERIQCCLVSGGQAVQVFLGAGDAGMAEAFFDHLQVGAAGKQPRGVRVPQIVSPDTVQPRCFTGWKPYLVPEPAGWNMAVGVTSCP